MSPFDTLQKQFDADYGSFMLIARCELRWDWAAFTSLTAAMYQVADQLRGHQTIDMWIANGFWTCDTWIRQWTGHDDFPRPDRMHYDAALGLLHDLAYFLFMGESPYTDGRLQTRALDGIAPP